MRENTETEVVLEALCARLVDMAGVAESAIADAILGLMDHNSTFTREIRAEDFRVHQLWLALERECVDVLGSCPRNDFQVVRFVTGVMKIGLDVKHIGDEAKNIADRNTQLKYEAAVPQAESLARMAEIVQSMLNDAVDAFVNRDAREAKSLFLINRQLLSLKADILKAIGAQIKESPGLVQAGLQSALVARSLTRVGEYLVDMATNTVHMFGERAEEAQGEEEA